ncbi:MAG: ATP-binding protein [Deltaproteobacteria bacterium]|nr:ATP-binding protein [Deltaproteobacteria bacterium]
MVFIGGPRQVGKTTLALTFLANKLSLKKTNLAGLEEHEAYLTWDKRELRKKILNNELPEHHGIIIFDEIHKFRKWRNLLKGIYDTRKHSLQIIVTGSAKLDYYRRGGDSLLGRYHHYRLHPLSLPELAQFETNRRKTLELLMHFSGFPEPFFRQDETYLRRWRLERRKKLALEDLRDLEQVREISLIELLIELLPSRVGSPLSIQNLAQDLESTHPTVKNWIEIMDRLYISFRISPFGFPKIRAVKKEQKLYLWDWSEIEDQGSRFENLVASHLIKFCHFVEDTQGFLMDLRYLRDTDGREIDFVVLKNKKPLFAVECKLGDTKRSKNLKYFKERTTIPKFYQVHMSQSSDYGDATIGGRILPFEKFCEIENLV